MDKDDKRREHKTVLVDVDLPQTTAALLVDYLDDGWQIDRCDQLPVGLVYILSRAKRL